MKLGSVVDCRDVGREPRRAGRADRVPHRPRAGIQSCGYWTVVAACVTMAIQGRLFFKYSISTVPIKKIRIHFATKLHTTIGTGYYISLLLPVQEKRIGSKIHGTPLARRISATIPRLVAHRERCLPKGHGFGCS
eukprot:scaffold6764_cov169-Amphora_coffeaeformis.AAC.7